MLNQKNVLVTGGAGFVGTNLIKRLLDTGANVRATLHKRDAVIKDEKIELFAFFDFINSQHLVNVVLSSRRNPIIQGHGWP